MAVFLDIFRYFRDFIINQFTSGTVDFLPCPLLVHGFMAKIFGLSLDRTVVKFMPFQRSVLVAFPLR